MVDLVVMEGLEHLEVLGEMETQELLVQLEELDPQDDLEAQEQLVHLVHLGLQEEQVIVNLPFAQLRIDKGYRRGALHLARRFITMIDVIVYYIYTESVYFSLFNDVYMILIDQHLREL